MNWTAWDHNVVGPDGREVAHCDTLETARRVAALPDFLEAAQATDPEEALRLLRIAGAKAKGL